MSIRPKPVARTSIMVYADTIQKADAVTVHMANKVGRPLTRSEALNLLIHREYAEINPQQSEPIEGRTE